MNTITLAEAVISASSVAVSGVLTLIAVLFFFSRAVARTIECRKLEGELEDERANSRDLNDRLVKANQSVSWKVQIINRQQDTLVDLRNQRRQTDKRTAGLLEANAKLESLLQEAEKDGQELQKRLEAVARFSVEAIDAEPERFDAYLDGLQVTDEEFNTLNEVLEDTNEQVDGPFGAAIDTTEPTPPQWLTAFQAAQFPYAEELLGEWAAGLANTRFTAP